MSSLHVPPENPMTASEATVPTPPSTDAARERTIRLVLVGLVLLVVGFTALLVSNDLYPCVPAGGSALAPPLSDCAVFLSPWAAVALVGLALAAVGYRRVL